MNNNLIFLGTGTSQGVPVIGCDCVVCKSKNRQDSRLRSSVIIQLGRKNILIDSGPDLRTQMLRENIKHIDAIFFTHEHRDHVAGIDDLRSFYFLKKEPIIMYMSKRVENAIKKSYYYLFSSKSYFGKPSFNIISIDKLQEITLFKHKIIPIQAMHYKLPVLGFRISNIAYLTDVNYIDNKEIKKLQDLKVLIVNCLQKEPHISHFNLTQVLELINFVKPKIAYLTHISHNLGLHKEVEKELPKNVFLAFDQFKIKF